MNDARKRLEAILAERIAVLDGSWGVLIQREVRGEEAYRGERFRDHPRDVAGDPDLLNITRPEIVSRIHRDYFAAGADIGELSSSSAIELYYQRRVERWDAIRSLWTPLVAAVSGFCLGGGCELAMSCDLIIASETAQFGQPETTLGIIPGAGGTQRLTRAVGKALAMDVILSGRRLTAQEALTAGLVSRVVAREAWLEEAKRVAREIAAKGPVATRLAKESVNRAYETTLQAGLEAERRALYLAFASEDAKEGLAAFTEKREPKFRGR